MVVRQTDTQTILWIDGQKDRQTDKWTDSQIQTITCYGSRQIDTQTILWIDGQKYRQTGKFTDRQIQTMRCDGSKIDRHIDLWERHMHAYTHRNVYKSMDGLTDIQIS